jgi:hypothetical protein
LDQTLLKVVRASDDPKQAGVGCCPVIGVVHDQLHLATDALESRFDFEFENIAGIASSGRGCQGLLQRPCLEQFVKPMPI